MVNRSEDVLAVLTREHDGFRDMLHRLDHAKNEERDVLLRRLRDDLIVHGQVEDEIVYPAFTGLLDDEEAERFVEDSLEEHAFIEELLDEMIRVPKSSVSFGDDLVLVRATLERHLDDEEDQFFPRLSKACSEAMLLELGRRVMMRQQALRRQRRRRRRDIEEAPEAGSREHVERGAGMSKTELMRELRRK